MIAYRKATLDDADMLARVRMDFLRDANNLGDDTNELALNMSICSYLARHMKDDSFIAFVAFSGGEIAATSGISFIQLPPNAGSQDGCVGYISNMFTYPKFRRQGIATKLFALTVDEARSRGCKNLQLHATEMGRPIYEKYGFRKSEKHYVYTIP